MSENFNPDTLWESYLRKNPTNGNLRSIIVSGRLEYKAKAWKQLLEQNPSNYDLTVIICTALVEYKAKAWNQLLEQSPTMRDLDTIINSCVYGEHKDKAKKIREQMQKLFSMSQKELEEIIFSD